MGYLRLFRNWILSWNIAAFGRHILTVSLMLKLKIVLGNEAEMIGAHILESADPSVFFSETADDFTLLYL